MTPAPPLPRLLRPDNFTPRLRTPWGGSRIISTLKSHLLGPIAPGLEFVGESWELSVEPDFPSTTADGVSLDTTVSSDPTGWLGDASGSAELLIKLLDAADDLSVQIHPNDDYAGLAAEEGGKPESWYVVAADEGASIYLGLASGVTRESLAAALRDGSDVSALLHRIEVRAGDFFVIEPGTPHAIGRGCLMVEPQRVASGKRGVTYRFWDWNRRYDDSGRPDERGAPRALHVEHALAVTRFDAPREDRLLDRIHRAAGAPDLDRPALRSELAGGSRGIPSEHLVVDRIEGTGSLSIEPGMFRGLVVLDGHVDVRTGGSTLRVTRGQTAAIPASARLELDLERAHAILAGIPSARTA